jgi:hypothetical protein
VGDDTSGRSFTISLRSILLVAVIVILLIGVGVISYGLAGRRQPTKTTNRSTAVAVNIPVIECPTTFAIYQAPPTSRYPSSIALSLSGAVSDKLSFFSDSTRSMAPVLGPRGWSCRASTSADGGVRLSVFPRNEATSNTMAREVLASSSPACQLCVYSAVCPFIPGAGTLLGYSGIPCNSTIPSKERVTWLNGSPTSTSGFANDEIGFIDPPGVAGTGRPSGGTNPATGVILFQYPSGTSGGGSVSQLTCTVPTSEHQLCSVVLSNFETTAWMMPSS